MTTAWSPSFFCFLALLLIDTDRLLPLNWIHQPGAQNDDGLSESTLSAFVNLLVLKEGVLISVSVVTTTNHQMKPSILIEILKRGKQTLPGIQEDDLEVWPGCLDFRTPSLRMNLHMYYLNDILITV